MRRRCRLGVHKWTQYKLVGPNPEQEPWEEQDVWETRCRYCQKKRRYLIKGKWLDYVDFGGGGG